MFFDIIVFNNTKSNMQFQQNLFPLIMPSDKTNYEYLYVLHAFDLLI